MVNGKVLYENGEFHVGDDPETIIAAAKKATDRIIGA